MDELKACPACGSDNVLIRGGVLNHYVECMESSCTMAGPARKGAVAARDAWNALPRTDYRALAQQLAVALERCIEGLYDGGHSAKGSECPWCTAYSQGEAALAAAAEAGVIA